MKVSVIMASYLGDYRRAAKNRDQKIIRAVDSVLNQSYKNIELVIIADGCQKTVDIIKNAYLYNEKIKGYLIAKQPVWSGVPRNTGIEKAEGEWICYLDIDDYFGKDHIKDIAAHIKPSDDWLWFDDMLIRRNGEGILNRSCNLSMGKCGTSNIIHRKIAKWDVKGSYAHDWRFIKNLITASGNNRKIVAGQYVVCHIPGKVDA